MGSEHYIPYDDDNTCAGDTALDGGARLRELYLEFYYFGGSFKDLTYTRIRNRHDARMGSNSQDPFLHGYIGGRH
jgi:hypothetical protein